MIEHQKINGIEISTYHVAKKGNWCSGDAYFITRTDDYVICAVADGLGSGEEAMNASEATIEIIKENHDLDLQDLMKKCNEVLWHKRGAVLTILKIDLINEELVYSNVGNIGCIFYTPSGRLNRPVPNRGYMSGKKREFKIQRLNYEKGMGFILFSDGLIFNPQYHKIISRMDSPKYVLEHLIDHMEDSDDDTTILIGKIA
ncbi:SpoIIE family protein phosphatase [Bacillus shivajii]|uniref:SpoIIE family protein phosphatase n=1 Tax=Bacillus shivajii TaxID=1983719 RepID=UPI001CF94974|nr:SpoIIE family protein phosphatase [Bacillus shivajii]UCZ53691.1 SpoIIE family protein phosphatase [Bacillus shivajii]